MNEHAAFVPAAGWVLPFAAMLLAIAILPLFAPGLWASNLRKLAVGAELAVVTAHLTKVIGLAAVPALVA